MLVVLAVLLVLLVVLVVDAVELVELVELVVELVELVELVVLDDVVVLDLKSSGTTQASCASGLYTRYSVPCPVLSAVAVANTRSIPPSVSTTPRPLMLFVLSTKCLSYPK